MYQLKANYVSSYLKNEKIYLVFDLELLSLNEEKNNNEIKDRLYEKIPLNGKEFIDVSDDSTEEVGIYIFDVAKWLKNTIKKNIINISDIFEKKIKVGRFPEIVSTNADKNLINKAVLNSFRNYIEKNIEIKKSLLSSFPGKFKSFSYFNFEYDDFSNFVKVGLKPEFRINPLLYTSTGVSKRKKMTFDESVFAILKTI